MKRLMNSLFSAARDTIRTLERARNAPRAGTPYAITQEAGAGSKRRDEIAASMPDEACARLLIEWILQYVLLIGAQIGMYSVSFLMPPTLIPLGVWYVAAWLIVPPFVVVGALKIAGSDEPFSPWKTAAIAVITLIVLAGLFALFIPIPGFLLFLILPATLALCAPLLGVIALDRIKARYRRLVNAAMLAWVIIVIAGWAWTITMPDGRGAYSGEQRAQVEEALRIVASQCIVRGAPESIDWGISAGESKWRVTRIDSLGDDQYRATVQFYTWMRVPTYAITVPGCRRIAQ